MNTYDLVISGHPLTVRSPADDAYVQRLARSVEERVSTASAQGAPPLGGALLAALGLADELMKSRAEVEQLRASEERLRAHAQASADALLTMLDDLQLPVSR